MFLLAATKQLPERSFILQLAVREVVVPAIKNHHQTYR